MNRHDIAELPLYHEQRASKTPTAARVFDLFAEISRHRLLRKDQIVQIFEPQLSPLLIPR